MVVVVFVYGRDRESNTLRLGSVGHTDPSSLTVDHVFVASNDQALIQQTVVDWYITTLSNDEHNEASTYEEVMKCTYYNDGWFYKVLLD